MGIQYEGDDQEEMLKLLKDNNRMLKQMRRSSLMGAIFKTVMWAAFIILPLWFYIEYIAPVMESILQTYEQIQGTNAQAQAQFGEVGKYLEQVRSMYGGGGE